MSGYLSFGQIILNTLLVRRFGRFPAVLLLILSLAACGGGGGGDKPNNPPPPPPPPPPPSSGFAEITNATGVDFAIGYSENPGDVPLVNFIAGGAAAGDYDDDGDIDLFVVRGDVGPNLLYRNDGNNTFTDVAAAAGLQFTKSATENYRHSGPMFADMDGDGDIDLYIGGVQGDPCLIFANNGDGTFTDVTATSGLAGNGSLQNISAAFGDYDLDGDLDLLLAHWQSPMSRSAPGDTEHLWRNESTANEIRFVSVSVAAGLSPSIMTLPDPRAGTGDFDFTFAPAFARVDDDLYPDILMVADFDTSMVFMNNTDGTFTNVTDVDVIRDASGMGSAIGDYDNDGDLDWFVTSIYREGTGMDPNGNRLYRNDDRDGNFVDVTVAAGVEDGSWGWAACFLDLDLDGHLDLYHTNGWVDDIFFEWGLDESRAFVANGSGTFSEEAGSLGLVDQSQGRGVVCADFDNDGDVDIFLWATEDTNGGMFFRNDASGHNYLKIKLNGVAPNTAATGARIRVTVGGTTQMREVSLNSNFVSQNPTDQIFGLATSSQADSVVIEWPDGQQTDLGSVQANQSLVVDHPNL
jgi:hypothetical protein